MAYTSIQNYLSSQEASPEPQVIVEEPEEDASILAASVKGVEFQIKVFFHQKFEECSELNRDNAEPSVPSGGITVSSHQLQSTNLPGQNSQPILSAISHETSFKERADEYDSGIQASMVSHLSGLKTSEEEEENSNITLLSNQEARMNEETNIIPQNYFSSREASPEPMIIEEAEDG